VPTLLAACSLSSTSGKSGEYRQTAVLPSMRYAFHLLREAMARDAEVVVTRGYMPWTAAVP
jgi:hypothetical protein